jgi:hypothetical protein
MNVRAPQTPPSLFRDISERLRSPLPERTRFLRELSFDIDELANRLMAEGLEREEARRRASAALAPDAVTLTQLAQIHASRYARLTARMSATRLRRFERATLAAAAALLLAVEATTLLRADLLSDASPFLWAVLGTGSATVVAVAAKAFQLWIKRDHSRPGGGLPLILVLAATTLLVGFGGALVDVISLAAVLEASPHLADQLVLPAIVREAVLLSIAILFALAAGLLWFLASQWIAFVEHEHQRAVSLDSAHTQLQGAHHV